MEDHGLHRIDGMTNRTLKALRITGQPTHLPLAGDPLPYPGKVYHAQPTVRNSNAPFSPADLFTWNPTERIVSIRSTSDEYADRTGNTERIYAVITGTGNFFDNTARLWTGTNPNALELTEEASSENASLLTETFPRALGLTPDDFNPKTNNEDTFIALVYKAGRLGRSGEQRLAFIDYAE